MELDSRIKEGKTYLDCYDTEIAKKFIGKECYLSDGVASFSNIDNLNKATLLEVVDGDMYPYKLKNTRWNYGTFFILPCEWAKEPEKKWRPFSLTEWRHIYAIGDEIVFRIKDSDTVRAFMFCGLLSDHDDDLPGKGVINLGGELFVLQNLFDLYELREDNEWQPFGVEIEEQE